MFVCLLAVVLRTADVAAPAPVQESARLVGMLGAPLMLLPGIRPRHRVACGHSPRLRALLRATRARPAYRSAGDLVNEPALFAAMNERRVSGIGFDMYRSEPHIDERWLSLPNATLLQHICSATKEVRTAMGMLAVERIESISMANRLPTPGVYGQFINKPSENPDVYAHI